MKPSEMWCPDDSCMLHPTLWLLCIIFFGRQHNGHIAAPCCCQFVPGIVAQPQNISKRNCIWAHTVVVGSQLSKLFDSRDGWLQCRIILYSMFLYFIGLERCERRENLKVNFCTVQSHQSSLCQLLGSGPPLTDSLLGLLRKSNPTSYSRLLHKKVI